MAALRAELAAVEPARACCRAAERAGLGVSAQDRQLAPAVARLARRLARTDTPGSAPTFAWATAPEHCRLAYVRALFLARGSLSLARGHTHLEFTVPVSEAGSLAVRLADIRLPATWRIRRGRGVVTWKGSETLMTFLRRAGGSAAVLELEARLVTRALRGDLNRALNAEGANVARSVAASRRQLASIAALERTGALQRVPPTVRRVAEARREAPEATLGELAATLGLSRSFVQRAFQRLGSLAVRPAAYADEEQQRARRPDVPEVAAR